MADRKQTSTAQAPMARPPAVPPMPHANFLMMPSTAARLGDEITVRLQQLLRQKHIPDTMASAVTVRITPESILGYRMTLHLTTANYLGASDQPTEEWQRATVGVTIDRVCKAMKAGRLKLPVREESLKYMEKAPLHEELRVGANPIPEKEQTWGICLYDRSYVEPITIKKRDFQAPDLLKIAQRLNRAFARHGVPPIDLTPYDSEVRSHRLHCPSSLKDRAQSFLSRQASGFRNHTNAESRKFDGKIGALRGDQDGRLDAITSPNAPVETSAPAISSDRLRTELWRRMLEKKTDTSWPARNQLSAFSTDVLSMTVDAALREAMLAAAIPEAVADCMTFQFQHARGAGNPPVIRVDRQRLREIMDAQGSSYLSGYENAFRTIISTMADALSAPAEMKQFKVRGAQHGQAVMALPNANSHWLHMATRADEKHGAVTLEFRHEEPMLPLESAHALFAALSGRVLDAGLFATEANWRRMPEVSREQYHGRFRLFAEEKLSLRHAPWNVREELKGYIRDLETHDPGMYDMHYARETRGAERV